MFQKDIYFGDIYKFRLIRKFQAFTQPHCEEFSEITDPWMPSIS